jgi:hypothetical protein
MSTKLTPKEVSLSAKDHVGAVKLKHRKVSAVKKGL